MRIKKYMPLMIFGLSLLGGCNSSVSTDPYFTFRIKGTVAGINDFLPIRGARVELYISVGPAYGSAITDDRGQYAFESRTTRGSWWNESVLSLLIKAEGYKMKIIDHEKIIHVRLTEEWQTIDVSLEPESKT